MKNLIVIDMQNKKIRGPVIVGLGSAMPYIIGTVGVATVAAFIAGVIVLIVELTQGNIFI